jgi:hypothetical protein
MPPPRIIDVARTDLFTPQSDLEQRYDSKTVSALMRIRDEYQWTLANPDKPDRAFVDTMVARHGMSERAVYADLAVIKQLLPALQSSSREWHRWKANQMLLETYEQAKRRHDTKTMERAAASYAKFNRVDLEDEQVIPYEDIVVQPFTATSDPTVLGIKPIENLDEVVKSLIAKYRQETLDIEDVEFEEADLEEKSLFGNETVEPHLLQ